MNNKHDFKGFIFKWGNNTCSLEQLAYKAIDKKQIALIIGLQELRGGTQL